MEAIAAARSTDAELSLRAQAGDRAACNELIWRYRPLVNKLITKLSIPRHVDREDLVAVGLESVWRAVMKWKPDRVSERTGRPTSFKTFCFMVVLNDLKRTAGVLCRPGLTCRNSHNEDKDDSFALDDVPDRERPAPPAGVREAVEQLPPVVRTVVEMHYGFHTRPAPWGKIAAATGLTVPQVKRALEQAIASF